MPIAWVSFSKQDREYKKQLLYYLGIEPQNTLEIPFKYQKYNGNLKIEENSYPLSNVLRPIDSDKTVAQMDKDENNQYYLNYSEKKIKEVFK